MVEQTSAAALQLQKHSISMSEAVSRFNLGSGRASIQSRPAASPQARPLAPRNAVHESQGRIKQTVNGPATWEEF